jgi:hypothetical protein
VLLAKEGTASTDPRERLLYQLRSLDASGAFQARNTTFDAYQRWQAEAVDVLLKGSVDLDAIRSDPYIQRAVPSEAYNYETAVLNLGMLQGSPRFHDRYALAAQDSMAHSPPGLLEETRFPLTGGGVVAAASFKSVQVAAMVALFESMAHVDLSDAGVVVEFGGGFGALAFASIAKLGFKGIWIMFDLPLASALQEYHLSVAFAKQEEEEANAGAAVRVVRRRQWT